ncbi:MAG: phosphoglycerate kinase [Deltaproteobacteria bacterium]|nr:phosphoglycerate kinase [Deltaproteobacteria bacterium]
MKMPNLDPRLRLMQQAHMKDKIVLIRVDHNVVKSGRIQDPYRIDATLGTLYGIAARGGRPILMTHIGRPRDKKTGKISCRETESVLPIVEYLSRKLAVTVRAIDFPIDPDRGIVRPDDAIAPAMQDLASGKIDMIYLPNSRWFNGEEAKGPERAALADELAGPADLYVNDAFGSYRAHASTFDIASRLPSYAGALLQKELANLNRVLEPKRPFAAVVAGAKYDTKIGPLRALYGKVDHLILGGIIYNTYLAAKYDIEIAGVKEEDKALAMEMVRMDEGQGKILEPGRLVACNSIKKRTADNNRSIDIRDLGGLTSDDYLLDVDPRSFDNDAIRDALGSANTIFVNAVMGMMPDFFEGSRALYKLINANRSAMKLFGGGDTLQALRALCPGEYLAGLDAPDVYFFTGGGSVLAAIEQGTPYGLEPVKALMNE